MADPTAASTSTLDLTLISNFSSVLKWGPKRHGKSTDGGSIEAIWRISAWTAMQNPDYDEVNSARFERSPGPNPVRQLAPPALKHS
jgi:hypothetical protein